MDTKTQTQLLPVIRAKHIKHSFDIFDGCGMRLATITLNNMSRSTATEEARKVAKSLSPNDWGVSYKEPVSLAAQFIADHVEVRS